MLAGRENRGRMAEINNLNYGPSRSNQIKIMNTITSLSQLRDELNALYKQGDANDRIDWSAISELYYNNVNALILGTGINQATADLICSEAYGRRHSAGYSEVVSYIIEGIDYAKQIIAANK